MGRLCFVIETMEVIDGHKLKSAHPDKSGYYTVPLAVIGITTQNKTYYIPEAFEAGMNGPNSPFAMQVKSGNMFGEFGHPFTKDLERIGLVMEQNYSHHIRKVWVNALPDGTKIVMGEVKPYGPYGKYLEESFASPYINTAFSLRSLCTETINRAMQRIDRVIRHFVTYDSVGSSGYKQSSKRYINLGAENFGAFMDQGHMDIQVGKEDLFSMDGGLKPAFENITTLRDNWITDYFDAKEVRIISNSTPVAAYHTRGSNNVIVGSKKLSVAHSLWSK